MARLSKYSRPWAFAPGSLIFAALYVAAGLSGCLEDNIGQDPSIVRVSPSPIMPGEPFNVTGFGLGEGGILRIAGEVCTVTNWEKDTITGIAPPALRAGHTVLSVEPMNLGLTTHPVEIAGTPSATRPPDPATVTDAGGPPTLLDAQSPSSVTSDAAIDATPTIQDATPVLDQATEQPLSAEFTPDPFVNEAVRITGRSNVPGLLFLNIFLGNEGSVGGIAFHLIYDPGLLTFEVADKEVGPRFQAKEIAPGRLAIGWVRSPNQGQNLELRFRLIGEGEGRIEFPKRHRTIRDSVNQPFPSVRWTTGSIRIRRMR